MNPQANKTCLALLPAQAQEAHLALFEKMGQELGFEVAKFAGEHDRVKAILHASFIIADLSGNDPQVLYDLGIAHTFGKRVFMMTDAIDTLAFDLASTRAWVIDASTDNAEIRKAMHQFMSIRQTIGPVRLFLGKYAFFGENLILQRFAAFIVDAVLVSAATLVCLLFVEIGPDPTLAGKIDFIIQQARTTENTPDPDIHVVVYVLMGMTAYFMVSTWLFAATLGQLFTGLRVLQSDYRHVTFGQSVGRTLLTFLVIMTYGAAFLSAMRGPGYRAVHDLLSGTIVVRRNPL